MHKTFTDCYFAPGFTGGGWGYALNSNDADGEGLESKKEASRGERRGWRTISSAGTALRYVQNGEFSAHFILAGTDHDEIHHAHAKTDLFDEEINANALFCDKGRGFMSSSRCSNERAIRYPGSRTAKQSQKGDKKGEQLVIGMEINGAPFICVFFQHLLALHPNAPAATSHLCSACLHRSSPLSMPIIYPRPPL